AARADHHAVEVVAVEHGRQLVRPVAGRLAELARELGPQRLGARVEQRDHARVRLDAPQSREHRAHPPAIADHAELGRRGLPSTTCWAGASRSAPAASISETRVRGHRDFARIAGSRQAWALLVVLEAPAPAERVAFVRHDVFGRPSPWSGDLQSRLAWT